MDKKRKGKGRNDKRVTNKKKRKVVISRIFGGLDQKTLKPTDKEKKLSDLVEDIEEYEVHDLYEGNIPDLKRKNSNEKKNQYEKEEEEYGDISFSIYQPGVSSRRLNDGHGVNSSSSCSQENDESEELSFGQNIISYNEGDISVLVPEYENSEKDEGNIIRSRKKYNPLVIDDYVEKLDPSAPEELSVRSFPRLRINDPHVNHYGNRYTEKDKEEGFCEVDFKGVKNAFSQVPGRPNCYTFGDFLGKGFSDCNVVDPFSLPIMYERRDFHMWTWLNEVYDYMTYNEFLEYREKGKGIMPLRDIKKMIRNSMKIKSVNNIRNQGNGNNIRQRELRKLSFLYQQLTEFTYERAFRDKGLTEKNILVYKGDPCARIVFLMKCPNYYDIKDCSDHFNPSLRTTSKSNGLGIIQDQLYLSLKERVKEFYASIGKNVTIGQIDEAVKYMIPMLSGECSKDGVDSGVAFLYCVPIYDPDQWGKKKMEKDLKEKQIVGYSNYGSQKEFPTNVLTFMDYSRIALRIISPIIVVSTSRFTTQCLSSGMDPKKMPGITNVVDKFKWFTVRMSSKAGGAGVGESTTSSKSKKAAVKTVYDPETRKSVSERLDTWCMRGDHPFLIDKQKNKYISDVKKLTNRISQKLFCEMNMPEYLTRKINTVTSFSFGSPNPNAKEKRLPSPESIDIPKNQLMIYGNYICKNPNRKNIKEYTRKKSICIVIGVVEEEKEKSQMENLDKITEYGNEETPCMKVSSSREINEFPTSILNCEFWKNDLLDIIHQACLYPGVELVKNLRERKTKTSVSNLVIRTKAINTRDKNFFNTLPRYVGINNHKDMQENRIRIDDKIKQMNKIVLEKNNNFTSFDRIKFMLQGFDENTNERIETLGLRKYDSWYSFLFLPRLIVDCSENLDHINSSGSIDNAVFYSSVLETIERTIFSEAHRIIYEEKKSSSNANQQKSRRGPPPFMTISQNVKKIIKNHYDHAQCALNSKGNQDINMQWTEILSNIGLITKNTLRTFVQEIL